VQRDLNCAQISLKVELHQVLASLTLDIQKRTVYDVLSFWIRRGQLHVIVMMVFTVTIIGTVTLLARLEVYYDIVSYFSSEILIFQCSDTVAWTLAYNNSAWEN